MRLRKRTCFPGPCHKYQQAIYEIPLYQFIWGTVQVDFMFGSQLRMHRSALCVAGGLGVYMYETEVKCNSPLF